MIGDKKFEDVWGVFFDTYVRQEEGLNQFDLGQTLIQKGALRDFIASVDVSDPKKHIALLAILLRMASCLCSGGQQVVESFRKDSIRTIRDLSHSENLSDQLKGMLLTQALSSIPETLEWVLEENIFPPLLESLEFDSPALQLSKIRLMLAASNNAKTAQLVLGAVAPLLCKFASYEDKQLSATSIALLSKVSPLDNEAGPGSFQPKELIEKLAPGLDSISGEILDACIEGFAYASRFPGCKRSLMEHGAVLQKIFSHAHNANVAFGIAVLIAHLSAYPPVLSEEQKLQLKLEELSTRQPNTPADDPELVKERCRLLIQKYDVLPTLFSLATSSKTVGVRSIVCQIYLSLASDHRSHGLIVQKGLKLLLSLAGSRTGELPSAPVAAQALAKIAISLNPQIAFANHLPELVRPFVALLSDPQPGQAQYEALMALTNLASTSQDLIDRIVDLSGLKLIWGMFAYENDLLRRAAVECLCNMMTNDRVRKSTCEEPWRLKCLVVFTRVDDVPTRSAATASLALLSGQPEAASALANVEDVFSYMNDVISDSNPQMQIRGLVWMANMSSVPDVAKKMNSSALCELNADSFADVQCKGMLCAALSNMNLQRS